MCVKKCVLPIVLHLKDAAVSVPQKKPTTQQTCVSVPVYASQVRKS